MMARGSAANCKRQQNKHDDLDIVVDKITRKITVHRVELMVTHRFSRQKPNDKESGPKQKFDPISTFYSFVLPERTDFVQAGDRAEITAKSAAKKQGDDK